MVLLCSGSAVLAESKPGDLLMPSKSSARFNASFFLLSATVFSNYATNFWKNFNFRPMELCI